MKRVLFALSCQILAMMGWSANAETVLIETATAQGQGWVFLRKSGCYVATAGHVLTDGAVGEVTGVNGYQATIEKIYRHETLDLAIARIRGSLAENCPASSLGDRDSRSVLKGIIDRGSEVAFERRIGSSIRGEGAYGLDIISVDIKSMTANMPLFRFEVVGFNEFPDKGVIKSDSGSPVRLRGAGFGEAGLPLGLVIAQDYSESTEYAFAIRMDAVRAFAEALNLDGISEVKKSNYRFSVTQYNGQIPDVQCGILNLENEDSPCGWRVQRGDQPERITLTVRLNKRTNISNVTLNFNVSDTVEGVSVSAKTDAGEWVYPRYCAKPAAASTVSCSIADWPADEVRFVFEAKSFELGGIQIQ